MKSGTGKYGVPVTLAGLAVCIVTTCCSAGLLYTYGDALLGITGDTPLIPNEPSGPAIVPADTSDLPEWTVMLYADADDDILEEDIWFDVNEMEVVGSTPQVNIVVQIDRAQGAFSGDGDWTDTRRLYVTQDADLYSITSPVVENIGEVDMGNPQTLVDFVTWSIQKYPAKKYVLIMSDHGGGWTGGFSDLNSNSALTFTQIVDAVEQVQNRMGDQKFEVIGFDACLMGMVEVYGSLYPYSNYMVASEEVIPSTGWSYAAWLERLVQDPTMDGRLLSEAIVSTYIVEDVAFSQRSSTEIAEAEYQTTLSAIESAQMPSVINAMNQFIDSIASVDQEWVAQGRGYSLSYYSLFGDNVPSPFIDLGNFAEIMATTNDAAIMQATDQLVAAISNAVVAEKHGIGMEGSSGISVHFPISDVYVLTEFEQDAPMYAANASRFLEQSSWDEFLAFHYTGETYEPEVGTAFLPNRVAEVVAPGASELTIAPVQLSDTVISGDEILTLNTTVSGNVSYIYFVLFFYNPEVDAYWIADTSYYFAENTTDVGGVITPDYGPGPIQINYEWDPTLFALVTDDYENYALFEPDEYLNSAEGVSTYSVYGQYTAVGGSGPVDAKLTFDPEGNLLNIYAFPDIDGDGISTAVAVSPKIGDTFTDYVQSYYYDEKDEPYFDYSLSGDVFTWGEQGFRFEARYPVDGDYAIGFYAVDFDNNIVSSYETITYEAPK